uniref:Uncharacterized protein n=1 Tax=Lotus japonicus TaxID=34305 RepID=I3SEY2_LOTJA|nr:unknown [Lotus japonicus]
MEDQMRVEDSGVGYGWLELLILVVMVIALIHQLYFGAG